MMPERKEYRLVAKDCKKHYKNLTYTLSKYKKLLKAYKNDVNVFLSSKITDELKKVPIEALNYNRARIPVAAIRAAGYEYVGQLFDEHRASIRSIYGVGDISMEKIENNLKYLFDLTKDNLNVVVNISKEKDKEIAKKLFAIFYYSNYFIGDYESLINEYKKTYTSYVKSVLKLTNPIRWFFSSKTKQMALISSAKSVVSNQCSEFLTRCESLSQYIIPDEKILESYISQLDEVNDFIHDSWPNITIYESTSLKTSLYRELTELLGIRIIPAIQKNTLDIAVPLKEEFAEMHLGKEISATRGSVTTICRKTIQPRGGFINLNLFKKETFSDEYVLFEENIEPGIVGTAVDYLTRFQIDKKSKEEAFDISLRGASMMGDDKLAKKLLDSIVGLDDESIRNALILVGYDATFRSGYPFHADINVQFDFKSIENVRVLVNRSVCFFTKFGLEIYSGLLFDGGYTNIVVSGDADYMIDDTIWDLKTSKHTPDKNATLQLMMYYLLAKHSNLEMYKNVKKVGIYNPRLNVSYVLDVDSLDKNVIEIVEKDVMGY